MRLLKSSGKNGTESFLLMKWLKDIREMIELIRG